MNQCEEKARVIYVEFSQHEGALRPYMSLVRTPWGYHDQVQIDYCRRDDRYLLYCAGGCPSDPIGLTRFSPEAYWASDDVFPFERTGLFARQYRRPAPRIALPSELAWTVELNEYGEYPDAHDYGSVYCQICKDHFPDDDHCGHLVWLGWGGFGGTGSCGCESPEDDVAAFAVKFGAAEILAALRSGRFDFRCDGEEVEDWMEMRLNGVGRLIEAEEFLGVDGRRDESSAAGASWLTTLEPDMPAQIAETIGWIEAHISSMACEGEAKK